jgi:ligand-binding SRPBCC domain-containing protein
MTSKNEIFCPTPFAVIRISSEIRANRLILWNHIVSMQQINKELMPFMRMTYPSNMKSLTAENVINIQPNEPIFISVLLLFGIIPFDLHWLAFEKVIPFEGFSENSSTLINRFWKHKRFITELGNERFLITDEVSFAPRISFLGHFIKWIVNLLFQHRHRQLKKIFNN